MRTTAPAESNWVGALPSTPVWIRSPESAPSSAGPAARNGTLAEEKWNSPALVARPQRALLRIAPITRVRGSDARLFGRRWRAPYVITLQPYMTYVKSVIAGTSTLDQNKSYLLRKGSHNPALRRPSLSRREPTLTPASGFEHCPNQAQYSAICYLLGHQR